MPRIYGLKPKFQHLLRPITNALARAAVSANQDGPMRKNDRVFVFCALGLLLGLNLPIVPVVRYVLWFVLVLLFLTIISRARGALAELRGSASR
jgi:hypothetical protein